MKTFISIIFLLIGSSTAFCQNDGKSNLTDDEINDLTSKLAIKLILSDTQKTSIVNLLKSYRSELEQINSNSGESNYKNKDELSASTNSKIELLLDSKQKMKFDVIQDDWWTSINKAEHN